PFRRLDGHAGELQVPARGGMEALGARALQDVIVLEVPAGGLEIAIALLRGVAIARAEEVMLELRRRKCREAELACGIDLAPQDRARRHGDELVALLVLHVAKDERAF